jgi:hypothetical protein
MDPVTFTIDLHDFKRLNEAYPNLGKNKDVGNLGIRIAELYLLKLGAKNIQFEVDGYDIQAELNGKLIRYEVKATADSSLAFSKLRVSSLVCHDHLVNGLEIMRICNVGHQSVDIYFLKHGIDFNLIQEPRWRLSRINHDS